MTSGAVKHDVVEGPLMLRRRRSLVGRWGLTKWQLIGTRTPSTVRDGGGDHPVIGLALRVVMVDLLS